MTKSTSVWDAVEQYSTNVLLPVHNNPLFFSKWLNNMRALETQLLVSPEDGWPVEDQRHTYTDGSATWRNIRWPRDAMKSPYWHDYPLDWLLEKHLAALGTTWWDWQAKESVALGFDFDKITEHAPGKGVTEEQLALVVEKAKQLDYVDVLKSTGGGGLHLYVWFEQGGRPKTQNHTEHAALGRAMLGKMSTDVGFDFGSHMDVCGGVMWCWATKMTSATGGFVPVSQSRRPVRADEVPVNWRDHLDVIRGTANRVRVVGYNETGDEVKNQSPLDSLTNSKIKVPLDTRHQEIISELENTGFSCVWVPDYHLLQTHTAALKIVYEKFADSNESLNGFFDTQSAGRDKGKPNCFAIPGLNGSFTVYRFGKGTPEHELWNQDGGGWTWCRYNQVPSLQEAAIAFNGVEDIDKKQFIFANTTQAEQVVKALGSKLTLPPKNKYEGRETILRKHKDGRLIVELAKYESDDGFDKWIEKKNRWLKVFNINTNSSETAGGFAKYDGITRSVRATTKIDAGWMICTRGEWVRHPRENVKSVLKVCADFEDDLDQILGHSILNPWTLVNMPFCPEYPIGGGRQWNYDAPQFAFPPAAIVDDSQANHPHWNLILSHCGEELDKYVGHIDWCKRWGIYSGKDYLTAWIACMFQEPFGHLPYLFLYGEQGCGKSILHEAISLLVTRGVVKADRALTSQAGFNGELANGVLAVIDEVDISKAGHAAYNKIKEWTLSQTISIHDKGQRVYEQPNSLHFVQLANHRHSCPVFPGDTRIVTLSVAPLIKEIPKKELLLKLEEEGPNFLATLLDRSLPTSNSRFRLPVIETGSKARLTGSNRDPLQVFLQENCHHVSGECVLFNAFYEKFFMVLNAFEQSDWTKRKLKQELPELLLVGKGSGNQVFIGNLSFTAPSEKSTHVYILVEDKLRKVLIGDQNVAC